MKPAYDRARSFSGGVASVTVLEGPSKAHHQFFIDRNGKSVFDLIDFKGSTLRILSSAAYLNRKFEIEFKIKAYPADRFSEGLACVGIGGARTRDKQYGFINKRGKFVIKPTPDMADCGGFSDGVVITSRENATYEFLDKAGKIIGRTKLYSPTPFHEGLSRAGLADLNPWAKNKRQ